MSALSNPKGNQPHASAVIDPPSTTAAGYTIIPLVPAQSPVTSYGMYPNSSPPTPTTFSSLPQYAPANGIQTNPIPVKPSILPVNHVGLVASTQISEANRSSSPFRNGYSNSPVTITNLGHSTNQGKPSAPQYDDAASPYIQALPTYPQLDQKPPPNPYPQTSMASGFSSSSVQSSINFVFPPKPEHNPVSSGMYPQIQQTTTTPRIPSGSQTSYPGTSQLSKSLTSSQAPPPLLAGQQYLRKAEEPRPFVHYNPYAAYTAYGSPWTQAVPVTGNLTPPPYAFPASRNSMTVYQFQYPHMAPAQPTHSQVFHSTRAQDDYMKQIRALQSYYGYTDDSKGTPKQPSNQIPPSNNHITSNQAPTNQKPTTNLANSLGISIDELLTNDPDFMQQQERLIKQFNQSKEDAKLASQLQSAENATKTPTAKPSDRPLTQSRGNLIDDMPDEQILDELLEEDSKAVEDAFKLVYPELAERKSSEVIDEKTLGRMKICKEYVDKARAYAYLDNTLWNLNYLLKETDSASFQIPPLAHPPPGSNRLAHKDLHKHSYLSSSRGIREPLDQSVGNDWHLMEDSPFSPKRSNISSLFGFGSSVKHPTQQQVNQPKTMLGWTHNGRVAVPPNQLVSVIDPLATSNAFDQQSKDKEIHMTLYQDNVDLDALHNICLNHGILKRVRAFVWQLMLQYIPTRANERYKVLKQKRMAYLELLETYLTKPEQFRNEDRIMFNLVCVDAPRTHPDGYQTLFNFELVQHSLERVLFAWSRKNPQVSYYQGLNDLASMIMVVFLDACLSTIADPPDSSKIDLMNPDPSTINSAGPNFLKNLESALFCVEADTYYCLDLILDRLAMYHPFSSGGVYSEAMTVHLEELIKICDPQLHQHIIKNELLFIQFAFRWMLCLFCRELETRNLVCLWDTYLAKGPDGFPIFHVYVCAAYLRQLRDTILTLDMINILGLIQHAPTGHFTKRDIQRLVQEAAQLQAKYPLQFKPLRLI